MKIRLHSILAVFLLSLSFIFITSCSPENTETTIVKDEIAVKKDSTYFLFISDIHLNTQGTEPSVYGQDTRLDLWEMLKTKLTAITTGSNPPKFIVYTGDLPDHHPDNGALHDTNIRTVLNELLDVAGDIPLFYAPGNNDPRGGDYFPYSDANCETPLDLARANSGYPAPNAQEIYNYNKSYGYYSARAFSELRVIGLNTVMFSSSHQSDYDPHCTVDTLNQAEESLNQLAWLRDELNAAKAQQQKVYLIMHIPPGNDAYQDNLMWKEEAWQDSLLQLAAEFEPSIAGMFFGHTHMDEVRRLSKPNDSKSYSVVAISAPGVSPIFNNNPGFKKVFYNDSYEPTDFETHFTFSLDSLKAAQNNSKWGDHSYRFSDVYGSGVTIKETVSKMSLETLYQKMMEIYMVKSTIPSGSKFVKEGISVD